MATWLRDRVRHPDPSSSPSKPPEPPPSEIHARLFGVMEELGKMGTGKAADLFPGGEAVAKLILKKARDMAKGWTPEQLDAYLSLAERMSRAIRTGEGYDELRDGDGG